jgi:hypothetical protein
LGAGCIFSPKKDDTKPPPPTVIYPKRDTPMNTIVFLQTAWTHKDSAQIAVVYADDYAGSSVDLTDPSSSTIPFSKSDEVRAVGGLALNQQITYVEMDFKSPYSWTEVHYAGDPSDWVTVQIPHFKITVLAGSDNGFVANSDATGETWIFEFTVKPTSGPSGTTYQIVRWVESRADL